MFLRQTDYLKQIRAENLEVVIGGDSSIRKDAELASQAEIESYLRHRYDTAKIFKGINRYDALDTYDTGDLITFPDSEDEIYNALIDGLVATPPTEGGDTNWALGDTRNPLIKMHLVDMTLYHLHSRINPRNIPDFRIARRDDCIKWLEMVAAGKISVDLPVLAPEEDQIGLKVQWGSNEKFNHNY